MEELRNWLVVALAPGIDNSTCARLLETFDSVAGITDARSRELSSLGLKHKTIEAITRPDLSLIDRLLHWADKPGRCVLALNDSRYPDLLRQIADPPLLLFVRGDTDYLQQPQLAMVGSRTPTAVGRRTAEDFARALSDTGITITSGLARGIDAACHRGALDGLAGTIAVMAHGLDRVYPPEHARLAEAICEHGALVSESILGTSPHKGLFPRRNRIISGLSAGTLVVEAAVGSGSLITSRHALEQGREVLAIPGSIHNPLARGCHQLLRGGAKLVETAADVLEEIFPLIERKSAAQAHKSQTNLKQSGSGKLDPDYQKLIKCLSEGSASIDELVSRCQMEAAQVASMLLILELQGKIIGENGLYTGITDISTSRHQGDAEQTSAAERNEK